ncbi:MULTISPECIES: regulatory protein RecX [unclassified Salinivibrio]|uniref:regulatory protein RecX n=1 Tax=unclassified Salinivibrio TaxID=2636825 RepID=UPI001F1F23B1|nr:MULTISPECIES: regulatory protein RecX [unclassified Salinivibrio]
MAVSCQDVAVGLLARRDHSVHELQQKLTQRGFDQDTIALTLDECLARGWLDDARFAASLLRQGVSKHHGWLRICQDAKRKGIDTELLSRAEQEQEVDWYALARETAQRKYADLDGRLPPAEQKEKAKRMRFLQSRGFNFDQIQYALSHDDSNTHF